MNYKNLALTNCNMAGGGLGGLTSQTLRPLFCGSDTPDCIGTARPHTSDRYVALKNNVINNENKFTC